MLQEEQEFLFLFCLVAVVVFYWTLCLWYSIQRRRNCSSPIILILNSNKKEQNRELAQLRILALFAFCKEACLFKKKSERETEKKDVFYYHDICWILLFVCCAFQIRKICVRAFCKLLLVLDNYWYHIRL